ncbi:DUF2079 domain-containing protein [Ilumatobacter sp.]|uniref:DUF2079 domain-containing protein n=1 Tax=Ilumatobacter sp. TaxID=1967498 RepID=UPI003AF6192D
MSVDAERTPQADDADGTDDVGVAVVDADNDAVLEEARPDDAPTDDDAVRGGATWFEALAVRWWQRIANVHPAAWLTFAGVVVFTLVFARLGVRRHDTFGTWAFDLGIYDQGFWLVSRGESFVTVRGIDFWGHHVNLIAIAFAPFYWLGAGPAFLITVQAAALGAGAIPTYLLARDRMRSPWVGVAFAAVYLMYAPIQWIAWANFHPEALVVTPLLFAWWFAVNHRWRAFFISIVIALSMREDTALAVFVMGLVLWWMMRGPEPGDRRNQRMALAASALGVVWYVVCTRLVIPAFNQGQQPFYIGYFYGSYGSDTVEIAETIVTRPDRVVSDATQPDRLRFYRDLLLPWGGLPLGGLLQLAMAGPQLLASVIGSSPYARSIRYQYTAVMIAPIVIASIEAAAWMWRYRFVRTFLVPWLLVCAYVTNVAWSPSPISANDDVWGRSVERHEAMRDAIDLVPDDVSVTATYTMGPHLSHREQIYDWPNPWVPSYWGNDDTYKLPDPSEIDYIVIDRQQVGVEQQDLLAGLIEPGGEYELLFDVDDVVVARRADP